MFKSNYKFVLASASPRRYEILSRVLPEFQVITSDVPENYTSTEPWDIVIELAKLKGSEVAKNVPEGTIVISADTIVYAGEEVLGKPKDEADFLRMLGLIKNNKHIVYTGVCVTLKQNGEYISDSFFEATEVYVDDMSDSEAHAYAATGEPYDKAGGYAIQGLFAPYIKGFNGDYYNVVGFPLNHFCNLCKEKGYIFY